MTQATSFLGRLFRTISSMHRRAGDGDVQVERIAAIRGRIGQYMDNQACEVSTPIRRRWPGGGCASKWSPEGETVAGVGREFMLDAHVERFEEELLGRQARRVPAGGV